MIRSSFDEAVLVVTIDRTERRNALQKAVDENRGGYEKALKEANVRKKAGRFWRSM